MIKLYDFPACPFGQKVRIVLAEKSLSYEFQKVDILQRENRTPEFRRLNPYAKVPVLRDEDVIVYDSTIINEYLEDEYPTPALLPSLEMSALRARARIFEDFADNFFIPQVGQLMAEHAKPESERDGERLGRLIQAVERMLDYLNHELESQQYIAGEFSLADIAFAPRLLVLGQLGIDVGRNRAALGGWAARLLERPSVSALEGVTVEPIAGI